ncbi:hypothetical protein FAM09_01325 [Niastella caeni]|uniref:Uncharacterized protein n=1 Tax=Niastella caeni TaxID=2569763 RepID=A0A4S8HZG8_9BACT|nr:hypothetical protein [Niastella caeni]THU40781.1 hypothetical protein FAM09_01325 [Niastella caeni]
MSVKINPSTHPEITLADQFLRYIPRSGKISKANLLTTIYKENPERYARNRDYFEVALEILTREKYVDLIISNDDDLAGTEYRLTIEGRALQDAGGYLKRYKERKEKESFDKKVNTAEGKKTIFDNKVKYILFFIVVLTAIGGLWPKRSSNAKKTDTQTQNRPNNDSFTQNLQDQSVAETTLTASEKPQPQNPTSRTPEDSRPQTTQHAEKKADNMSLSTPSKPIQVTTSDNIEFKLVKVTGNAKTQSVTCTLVLTTSAANWYIMSQVKSIIDGEGNEYKLKSFTNGASDYLRSIDLITGIPIKCTYTFSGVLADVKTIKLFKYDYSHSAGEPYAVEFRDIPVDWK